MFGLFLGSRSATPVRHWVFMPRLVGDTAAENSRLASCLLVKKKTQWFSAPRCCCLTPVGPPPLSRQAHAAPSPAHGADVTRDTTMGSKATCSKGRASTQSPCCCHCHCVCQAAGHYFIRPPPLSLSLSLSLMHGAAPRLLTH